MYSELCRALVGGIQKFSTEDGPGIRTTVFLKGCPLSCKWCHNPELIEFGQQIIEMPASCIKCGACIEVCQSGAVSADGEGVIHIDRIQCNQCMNCVNECYANGLRLVAKPMTVQEVMAEVDQDKGFYDNTGGGMTISGGEMLSHPEFVAELIHNAYQLGINVCLDTSGAGDGDKLVELASEPNVTHILYDMKSIDDEIHKEYTGVSNAGILHNLRRLALEPKLCSKIQMRMPLIGGINDSWDLIESTAQFYIDNSITKVTLLPYHNLGVSKEKHIGGEQSLFDTPTNEYVDRIKKYFETKADMEVEILGRL